MASADHERLVLAIAPPTRGFGYVVFEGSCFPVDWGVKDIRRDKKRRSLAAARALFTTIAPETLDARRRRRISALVAALSDAGTDHGIRVCHYPKTTVRALFATRGARNKDDVAALIAADLPELGHRLPPRRRIWQSARYAMAIFEAAALALTHYAEAGDDERSAPRRAA